MIRVFLLLSMLVVPGVAQVRTWVSTSGLDSNPCTRTEPCRNFNAAVTAVEDDGETIVLDSGGYGPTTISKSINIIAPEGIHAAIAPTAGHAIHITAGARVRIRNLFVNNRGSSVSGIQVDSVEELFIDKTTIQGFADSSLGASGINIQSFDAFHLSEVVVRHCYFGVTVLGSSSKLYVERSRFEQNFILGLAVLEGVTAAVQDSIFTDHLNGGLLVNPFTGSSYVGVERCTFAGNGRGIQAGTGLGVAVIDVSNSVLLSNSNSIVIAAGDQINSRGNNTVRNNANTNAFSNTFGGM